ncbi:hypothetical protein SUGI_0081960 [Cryptomeria japonica]|uniref:probable 2' cyclic ADP-D-ribose synthase BdTIR n=1 Tax=Cryptomeria japonica TaxID=3369 RepID=UPI002408AE26|nr:probable 2' cyclic ADP-D-ribose synthase BdTIR [Cryptomeria japonica]GLJ08138.1 hypothetical protein SUGI_0081960 [Cryptomeria japonica]
MENIQTNASQQIGNSAFHRVPPKTRYNVFINHRGADVKETLASLIYHNLQNKGCNAFLDKKSIQVGKRISKSIGEAMRTAAVHVAIFSANYADSTWCLKELYLMLKSGAPIVPVFCGVHPSELRMEYEDGQYARAFQMHKDTGKIRPQKLNKWKKALRKVSRIEGYIFQGDQGDLLEEIATTTIKYINAAKRLKR